MIGAKRSSGGVSIFFRNELNLTRVSNLEHDTHIWVRITNDGNDNHIFLCAIYIPPESSRYGDISVFDFLEQDMVYLRSLYRDCEFILAGDFNARTADLPDFIDEHYSYTPGANENSFENERETTPRFSRDKELNNYGRRLVDLCKLSSLRICNGRLPPVTETGNFTYVSYNGSSVIDYVIASQSLMLSGNIKQLAFIAACNSDHFPIAFTIIIRNENLYNHDRMVRSKRFRDNCYV